MRFYRAYGLDISSEVHLPELDQGSRGGDVVVRLGSAGGIPEAEIPPRGLVEGSWHSMRLLWAAVGAFAVRNGDEIIAEPLRTVDPGILSLYLTHSVLAALLSQRGLMVVHAAALDVDGGAVLFAGHSGSGKSTLAGAMAGRGHGLMADDITAVDLTSVCPHVLPGVREQKLWPDSVEALGLRTDELSLLREGESKRRRLVHAHASAILPLRRLYYLHDDDDLRIEPATGMSSFLWMAASSYTARLHEAGGRSAELFAQCIHLLRHGQIRHLRRPKSWHRLPDVVKAVEHDLKAVGSEV